MTDREIMVLENQIKKGKQLCFADIAGTVLTKCTSIVIYKWAQKTRALHFITLAIRMAYKEKHLSFMRPFVSYKEACKKISEQICQLLFLY